MVHESVAEYICILECGNDASFRQSRGGLFELNMCWWHITSLVKRRCFSINNAAGIQKTESRKTTAICGM